MAFNLTFSSRNGAVAAIPAALGGITFILGTNGTGKSALMQKLHINNQNNSRWISAHRQNWLASNTYELSPAQKKMQDVQMIFQDQQDTARWRDDQAAVRSSNTIYNLLDAENVRAREIAEFVTDDQIPQAVALARMSSPVATINELLAVSNLPIVISVQSGDSIVASKSGGNQYSIAELSDGERNTILIAANVLTAPQGTLVLIDEPERHLHRSIISPFLILLFSKRPDCAFIVSTHDLGLPLDHPSAQVVLARGCAFTGSKATSWDVDFLAHGADLDDDLKADILGNRRKIIFVEGREKSLDKTLYSILFPGVSVEAKDSCKDVESHVDGIRGAAQLHWVKAFGIVDRDQLDEPAITKLVEKGVYALTVYSVEGLYYHPDIQRLAAIRHATVTGTDVCATLDTAKAAALASVVPHINRLAARMTEMVIRHALMVHAPTWKNIETCDVISVAVDAPAMLKKEVDRLTKMVENNDLVSIVQRYPIRTTSMIGEIVRHLRFSDRAQYEGTVRKLAVDDPAARACMLRFFGKLPDHLAAA